MRGRPARRWLPPPCERRALNSVVRLYCTNLETYHAILLRCQMVAIGTSATLGTSELSPQREADIDQLTVTDRNF